MEIIDLDLENSEEWKDIPNYEGYYKINRGGVVVSVERKVYLKGRNCYRTVLPRIRVHVLDKDGYSRVQLYRDHKGKNYMVHKLILLSFVGYREGLVCRHKDGDRSHSTLDNLEYGTVKDNTQDRRKHGTYAEGEKHPRAKHTEKEIEEIREAYKNKTMKLCDIKKRFNIKSYGHLRDILTYRRWKNVS